MYNIIGTVRGAAVVLYVKSVKYNDYDIIIILSYYYSVSPAHPAAV